MKAENTSFVLKMTPLGMEVGLGTGHIVLDGDLAPPKGHNSSPFSTHVYCGETADGPRCRLVRR